jgi:hypothetical protein
MGGGGFVLVVRVPSVGNKYRFGVEDGRGCGVLSGHRMALEADAFSLSAVFLFRGSFTGR